MKDYMELVSFFVVLVTLFGLDSYRTNQLFERITKLEDKLADCTSEIKRLKRRLRAYKIPELEDEED